MTQKRKRTPIQTTARDANFFRQLWDQVRLSWSLLKDSRVPILYKVIPFITIAYLLSPIDFIPDILVGLGWLDDIGLLLLGMSAFNNLAPGHVVAEHLRRLGLDSKYGPMIDEDGFVIDVKADPVDED